LFDEIPADAIAQLDATEQRQRPGHEHERRGTEEEADQPPHEREQHQSAPRVTCGRTGNRSYFL